MNAEAEFREVIQSRAAHKKTINREPWSQCQI